jgi:hypothetical protein
VEAARPGLGARRRSGINWHEAFSLWSLRLRGGGAIGSSIGKRIS